MRLVALILLACLLATPALAGNPDRTGTAGGGELRIPVSARGVALGNGVVADIAGVEALYFNPAGATRLNGTELYFSHMNYIADMKKNYFAAAIKTGYGSFGISADIFSVGDMAETTEDSPEGTGRTFSPTFSIVGLTYSRFLTDAVSVGLTGKMINESILNVSTTGVAFDVGLQYRPGFKNLRLGLLLRDFGPQMRFSGDGFETFHSVTNDPSANPHSLRSESASFELPSTFQAGVAYAPWDDGTNRIDGFGSFINNNFGRDEYSMGAEYSFKSMLSLRGSWVVTGTDTYNFGPAFGAGVKIPINATTSASVDYCLRTVKNYFDDNQLVSLKFTF
jgi:hypothetical protein